MIVRSGCLFAVSDSEEGHLMFDLSRLGCARTCLRERVAKLDILFILSLVRYNMPLTRAAYYMLARDIYVRMYVRMCAYSDLGSEKGEMHQQPSNR